MPIHEITLPSGTKGFQWGNHGAKYSSRADAERQAAAAHANGYAGDGPLLSAAGALLTAPSAGGPVALFMKRAKHHDHAGTWGLPGGAHEAGENPYETALREIEEETGQHVEDEGFSELGRSFDDGVDFTTYHRHLPEKFEPRLNSEHTEAMWAPLSAPPSPLHPGVAKLLSTDGVIGKITERPQAHDRCLIALDRDSVRTKDQDGHLHVTRSNISKAAVNPYLGAEIPDGAALGLKPDKIYMLLRDPEELERAAKSFEGKPLLMVHRPQVAEDHDRELTVGSVNGVKWEPPYLTAGLHIWDGDSISLIENDLQKELSCGYRYRADMTPGTYEGTPYDGVMRDIQGNHVALVPEGRAGSDVVVGDSKENLTMGKIVLSRRGLEAAAVLTAFLMPKLAKDRRISFGPLLRGVNAKNWATEKPKIIGALDKALKSDKAKPADKRLFAADASLEGMHTFLNSLDKPAEDDEPEEVDPAEPIERETAEEEEAEDGEEDTVMDAHSEEGEEALFANIGKMLKEFYGKGMAGDDPPEFPGKPANPDRPGAKLSMDKVMKLLKMTHDGALIAAAKSGEKTATKTVKQAMDEVTKNGREVREALKVVRPYVGELAEDHDTASGVYAAALKVMGLDAKGVTDPVALRLVLESQQAPGSQPDTRVAMDSASQKSFDERFPDAARFRAA